MKSLIDLLNTSITVVHLNPYLRDSRLERIPPILEAWAGEWRVLKRCRFPLQHVSCMGFIPRHQLMLTSFSCRTTLHEVIYAIGDHLGRPLKCERIELHGG